MSQAKKALDDVLSGRRDQTIRFETLVSLLIRLGFDQRIKGSHHIFSRDDIAELVNLQPRSDDTAKPYQVKQVRELIARYQLGFDQ
jgi:predicted RNA binding protein YcfA (HicA-like mRNA interferase family)